MKATGFIPGFGACMIAAFIAGRYLPMDRQPGDAGSGGFSEVGEGRKIGRSDSSEWDAPTAAGRTLGMLRLIDNCRSREDFLRLVAEIETRADKSEKQRFLALLFAGWLEKDPTIALAEVRRVELLRHDAGRVAEVFREWAAMRPDQAAATIAGVLDGRQSDPAAKPPFLDGVDPPDFLLSMISGLGESDPKLAAATLARVDGSLVRSSAVEVLLQDWYVSHPGDVQEWAASIADAEFRREVLAVAGGKAGQNDEVGSALTWATGLSNEVDRATALKALTEQWSHRHAAEAYAWVRELGDGPLKFELMPGVIRQLTIIDPGAAADWMNLYDAAPEMDASIAAYAKAIQFTNPEAALGSAAAITNPEQRAEVIEVIRRNQAQ